MQEIKIDAVRIDGGTQSRVAINEATVAEYAETLTEGVVLPPVVVFFDGADYWLADGFHRFFANKRIGALTLEADVHAGDRRAAVLYSCSANAAHGLRRTNADKRKAVETLANDAEWSQLSDREIAKRCGVSVTFVSSVRRPEVAEKRAETRQASAERSAAKRSPATPAEPDLAPRSPATPADAAESDMGCSPATPGQDDDGLETLEEVIENLSRENQALSEQVASLSTGDDKAEVLRLAKLAQGYELRISDLTNKVNSQDKELRYFGKFTSDLRKATGADTNRAALKLVQEAFKLGLVKDFAAGKAV